MIMGVWGYVHWNAVAPVVHNRAPAPSRVGVAGHIDTVRVRNWSGPSKEL